MARSASVAATDFAMAANGQAWGSVHAWIGSPFLRRQPVSPTMTIRSTFVGFSGKFRSPSLALATAPPAIISQARLGKSASGSARICNRRGDTVDRHCRAEMVGNDGAKALRVAADHLCPMMQNVGLRRAGQKKSSGNNDKSFHRLGPFVKRMIQCILPGTLAE